MSFQLVQVQHLLKVVLPLLLGSGLGAFLSGVLSQDIWQTTKYGRILNASIVCVVTGLFALASAFAAGSLSNDYTNDFYIIATAFTAILSTSGFAPLREFIRASVFVLPDTSDPLAHRSLPTTQDNDPHATQPQIVNNLQSQRYQAYINQPTAVMPTQTGYDVEVGNVINGVPARSSRPDATSGGITSNAFMPQQQQFISRIRKADNGG